jgi:hypothetical protein
MKFWQEISIEEYHGNARAISKSKLASFADCISPHRYRHLEQKKGQHLVIGQLFEDLVQRGSYSATVKPETYTNEKGEVKPWTGAANVCKAWLAEHAGETVISADEHAMLQVMHAAFLANPLAAETQAVGVQQPTLIIERGGVMLQARPDYYLPEKRVFRDVKSCESLEDFDRDVLKFRYHWQAALSIDLAKQITSEEIDYSFEFITVDKQVNPECQVVQISKEMLNLARCEMNPYIETLSACIKSGVWPRSEEHRLVKNPRWLR